MFSNDRQQAALELVRCGSDTTTRTFQEDNSSESLIQHNVNQFVSIELIAKELISPLGGSAPSAG